MYPITWIMIEDGIHAEPALVAAPCFTMCEVMPSAGTSSTRPWGKVLPYTSRDPDVYGGP